MSSIHFYDVLLRFGFIVFSVFKLKTNARFLERHATTMQHFSNNLIQCEINLSLHQNLIRFFKNYVKMLPMQEHNDATGNVLRCCKVLSDTLRSRSLLSLTSCIITSSAKHIGCCTKNQTIMVLSYATQRTQNKTNHDVWVSSLLQYSNKPYIYTISNLVKFAW